MENDARQFIPIEIILITVERIFNKKVLILSILLNARIPALRPANFIFLPIFGQEKDDAPKIRKIAGIKSKKKNTFSVLNDLSDKSESNPSYQTNT